LDLFAESLQEKRVRCRELARNRASGTTLPLQGAMRLLEIVKSEVPQVRAVVSFESRNGYLVSGTPIGSITGLLQALSRLIPALMSNCRSAPKSEIARASVCR
jgi:hypothetical protein